MMKFALALATVGCLGLSACSSPAKVTPKTTPSPAPSQASPSTKAKVPDLESSPFPLTLWAAFLAERDYVDPARFSNEVQMDAVLAALESHEPKLFARRTGQEVELSAGDWSKRYPMPKAKGMRALSEALVQMLADCVKALKLEGKARHELEYAAFNGLLEPLDPHTNLLTPEQNASLGVRTRGHFGGIGAEIWSEDRRIRIVRVLPDSPAEKAGVMDNDLVYRISGRSTVNMGATEAQRLLRGPIDSKVKIIVRRKKQLKPLTIKRGKISIPSVRAFALPDKTGYVELLTFQEKCAKDTLDAMKAQLDAGAKSLILDLRRNTGGLLTEALALVDGLVSSGELISVLSREGREVESAKPEVKIPKTVPLVVMISQSSASASEIVSGALGVLGRAVVVGRRSFGKGSVQQLMPSKPYGEELALKLTIAEYRVAKDTKIQGKGVVPTLAMYPMRLGDHRGVGNFFDVSRFEKSRENSVYRKGTKESQVRPSPFELRYLARTPWQKFPRNLKDKAARAWLDPELKIAAGLGWALAKASPNESTDAVVASFVQDQRKVQHDALVAALKRWKIDWKAASSEASLTKQSPLSLTPQIIEIEKTGASGKVKKIKGKAKLAQAKLEVGDIFTLRLSLENLTDKVLHQVHLRTKYFLPELDDIELVFGKIPAKGRPHLDLRLQIPPGRASHEAPYEFEVFVGEKAKTPVLKRELNLAFAEPKLPRLEFNYWIVDSPSAAKGAPARPKHERIKGEEPFEVAGNGDGRVRPGEKVLIAFEVINKGDAVAGIPSIVVRNRSREQALLEEGAAPLKELAPNQSAFGAIAMTVSDSADPKKPIDLQLMVGDRKSSQVVEREVHLEVEPVKAQEGFVAPEKPEWVKNKKAIALRTGPGHKGALLGEISVGQTLQRLGSRDGFTALGVGKGRVLWAKTDPTAWEPAPSPKKRAKGPDLSGLRAMVVAPQIDLKIPHRSTADKLAISGHAQDDGALEDVVIWTIPKDPKKEPRKLLYQAVDPKAGPEASKSMGIATQVELVPGPQRIRVIVRDTDKVSTEKDYWISFAR